MNDTVIANALDDNNFSVKTKLNRLHNIFTESKKCLYDTELSYKEKKLLDNKDFLIKLRSETGLKTTKQTN